MSGMKIQFTVDGVEQLRRNFKSLDRKMQKKVSRAAVRTAANVIRDQARQNAPRGRTGRLKKGIIVESKRGRPGVISFNVGTKKEVFYGRFVEFGTQNRAANPFFRRAFKSRKVKALGVMAQKLKAGIADILRTLR